MPKNVLFATLLAVCLQAAHFCTAAVSADETAVKVSNAGKNFLGMLDAKQRAKALFQFGNEAQRKRWSNLPSGIFKREGLRLGDLSDAQRKAVWQLLAAALSERGYEKAQQIVEGDEVLKQRSSSGSPPFGRDEYYISILGEPSTSEPWMIQFGGHHLALNITLVGTRGTLAPSHTAAQPAVYEIEGKTIKPLGRETEKAFALINALNQSQRQKALIGAQTRDLVLGPGRDGETIQPEGVRGSELTEKQHDMLLDLVSEWTGMQNEAMAQNKLEEVRKHLAETWFAWSGPTEKGAAAYFRIQGPTVIIEYAPQRLGGDPTQHIHTIYRDPTNDYGSKWRTR